MPGSWKPRPRAHGKPADWSSASFRMTTGGQVSRYVTIPILTGMGSARNTINVLSSHVVVACQGGAGTVSEIALALKTGRRVILMDLDTRGIFERYEREGLLQRAESPRAVIDLIKAWGS